MSKLSFCNHCGHLVPLDHQPLGIWKCLQCEEFNDASSADNELIMKCQYCKQWIAKGEQRTDRTTYNPRVVRSFHPECARKDAKRTASKFTIHLGTWTGI